MKRKHIESRAPKFGVVIILGLLLVMLVVGVYKDSMGEFCAGFMGASYSCVEEATSPVIIIGFPLLLFFGAWWAISYSKKSIQPSTHKKAALKNKKHPKGTLQLAWTRTYTTYILPKPIAWVGGVSTILYLVIIAIFDSTYQVQVLLSKHYEGKVDSSLVESLVFYCSLLLLLLLTFVWIYGLSYYRLQRKKHGIITFQIALIVIFSILTLFFAITAASGFARHF